MDPQVAVQAVDTQPIGETSRISPARMVKAPPPPFSGSEKDWGSFKDDFTFAQYYGFAYVLTSQRHIEIDATSIAQSVIAGAIR